MADGPLRGQVALVYGARGGPAAAIAETLVAAGAEADAVGDPHALASWFEEREAPDARLDLLVACGLAPPAAAVSADPFWKTPLSVFEGALAAGPAAAYTACARAARWMTRRGRGLIVLLPGPPGHHVAAAASRAALERLASGAAGELRPRGVAVLVLQAGPPGAGSEALHGRTARAVLELACDPRVLARSGSILRVPDVLGAG